MDCFLVSVVVLFGAGVSAAAFRKMEHGFGPYNLRAAMLPLVTTLAVLLGLTGTASKEAVMGLLGGDRRLPVWPPGEATQTSRWLKS